MHILIACEYSGVVRDAFRLKGHDAISCDLLPTESNGYTYHYQGDVLDIIDDGWDMVHALVPARGVVGYDGTPFKAMSYKVVGPIPEVDAVLHSPFSSIDIVVGNEIEMCEIKVIS